MSRDTAEERKREDDQLASTVLVVLGWILPLAGLAFGPGSWWAYVIWLAIGTALIAAHEKFVEKEDA